MSRHLDNGLTLEVTRLASDGCPNACSCLYGAAWRAAKALGYGKLITYILESESGTTLKASGWKLIGKRGGGELEYAVSSSRRQAPPSKEVSLGG